MHATKGLQHWQPNPPVPITVKLDVKLIFVFLFTDQGRNQTCRVRISIHEGLPFSTGGLLQTSFLGPAKEQLSEPSTPYFVWLHQLAKKTFISAQWSDKIQQIMIPHATSCPQKTEANLECRSKN